MSEENRVLLFEFLQFLYFCGSNASTPDAVLPWSPHDCPHRKVAFSRQAICRKTGLSFQTLPSQTARPILQEGTAKMLHWVSRVSCRKFSKYTKRHAP